MSKKLSLWLCYALVLSIALLVAGLLGLGIRAFTSERTANTIFFAEFTIFAAILIMFFVLRRLFAPETKRIIATVERQKTQRVELR
jgi:ABC-type Na+ efflux pump permease subunit